MQDELCHYGIKRRSGRYPWGSGKRMYQRSMDFIGQIEKLQAENPNRTLTNSELAASLGMKSSEFQAMKRWAGDVRHMYDITAVQNLLKKEPGLTNAEIANRLGFKNESNVREIRKEEHIRKFDAIEETYNFLKDQVDQKGMIDVTKGVERELGITKERMQATIAGLKSIGYVDYKIRQPQVTNAQNKTIVNVLCKPGTEYKDAYQLDKIHPLNEYISDDMGESFKPVKMRYPASLDPKRVQIKYAEDGGITKDGVIEIRRNTPDLSLGDSRYSQVRILVNGTHYLKGMAVYADDLPDGIDVRFNTNKSKGTPMLGESSKTSVLKPIKTDDPNNPFGSQIKTGGKGQYEWTDENGQKHLSLINKKTDEGDWADWSNTVSAQFLAKQPKELAKRQLDLTAAEKRNDLQEIMALENPVIKKYMLEKFAESADSDAVDLKATAFPRQKYECILPVDSMKETEVYAPSYKNGEKLALIRYPHAGLFEIPILTVNNKNKEAEARIGKDPIDAVGINHKVAERMSGADFDGDFVMTIPVNSRVPIKNRKPLEDLDGFDPKAAYPGYDGMKVMRDTQKQMGVVSNLISDMTIKGADPGQIAKAVRHSMVVIDAEKHGLNWKQSEIDNDIQSLKDEFQKHVDPFTGKEKYGASTLITMAKSEVRVPRHRGNKHINKETGELEWTTPPIEYVDYKTGETVVSKQTSNMMSEVSDAKTLYSKGSWGYPIEEIYAQYANTCKSLANEARKESLNVKMPKVLTKAEKEPYTKEIASLEAQLDVAAKNKPKERQAQRLAAVRLDAMMQDNPSLKDDKQARKKKADMLLNEARAEVGAKRHPITISDKEWEAIQAHAISNSVLREILNYVDDSSLRQLAMPKSAKSVSVSKQLKIKTMHDSGEWTLSEIAEATGLSTSTVSKYLKGVE